MFVHRLHNPRSQVFGIIGQFYLFSREDSCECQGLLSHAYSVHSGSSGLDLLLFHQLLFPDLFPQSLDQQILLLVRQLDSAFVLLDLGFDSFTGLCVGC